MQNNNHTAFYMSNEDVQKQEALHAEFITSNHFDDLNYKSISTPAPNNEALKHARNTTLASSLIRSLHRRDEYSFDIYLDLLLGGTSELDYRLWRDRGESDCYINSECIDSLHEYLFDGYDISEDISVLDISHEAESLFIRYTPSMSLTDYFAINIAIALRY